jgi:hypothetical protein
MTLPAYRDSRVWWAFILIALGLIFLLEELTPYDVVRNFFRTIGDWWPMILVIIGVFRLLGDDARARGTGLFLIGLGAIFQAIELRLFTWLRWNNFWPLLLILIGVLQLFRKLGNRPAPTEAPPPAPFTNLPQG